MKQALRKSLNISRFAIKYARLTICFWVIVTFFGIFAFSSLRYALFPDVSFPIVVIQATVPLNTAEETELKLTNPLEKSLRSLNNAELFSSSYPGQSIINVAFDARLKLDESTKIVRSALKQADLPSNASVKVRTFSINESAAISYAIQSETQPLERLTDIARQAIIPPLEKLPGVSRVELLGDGNFREVKNTKSDETNPPTLVRFNRKDVLSVRIVKQADANTLNVVSLTKKAIDELQNTLPDVQLILAETQADYIEEATQSTIQGLIGAIVLAILVIFPFLRNFQATLITALTIPISLLGTAIVMMIAGFNLETLTLLALALVVGIIVDDAIVDVENITRHIDRGENPKKAAIKGTDEIGLTVTASTITIAAVFIPIAFIGGNLEHFFKPFGLTVSAAVFISLMVARTLSPVLAIYWMKPRTGKPKKKRVFFLVRPYLNLLNWSLLNRKTVMAIALISLILGLSLIPLIPRGFVPKLDRGEFNILYTLPVPKIPQRLRINSNNTTSSWISDLAQSPEQFLLRINSRVGRKFEQLILDDFNVKSAYTIAGIHGDPLKGKIYVKLNSDRQFSTSEVQERIRNTLPKLRGVTTSIEDILFVETGDDSTLKVALLGNDFKSLRQTADKLKLKIKEVPGLVDVRMSSEDEQTLVIEHFQRQRVIYITANLTEKVGLGDITNQVISITQSNLPYDISFDIQGASAQVRQIFSEFAIALILAVVCMIAVLYISFGRWLEPLVVVLSLPLTLIGAMLALLITQNDFGMISLIGLIFLLGLLDKNAVLLMDYISQLRQQGINRHQAILETGEVRLRPIIMTTTSTILGMLPIALGLGAGSELRQPMAVAIIGGLITSSLLSLIIVPVLYTLLEDGWMKVLSKIFNPLKKLD
ncbi:efflux RND transporter permease subunit [cyanobacterium endosymbiont of Epithemia turgida]|uniref:efflux RND transporter permease subunit n=1 Tax=cyanobacterium endosymbiont of Epithemia turgida TaxID=718217 RepID=UPI0004D1C088|nr:efflux RND transporter permease subunit [cyanobacterium endosymbiont of Epithemia turgida]BAP18359.1 acriflavin resistance protein [cyanobacterium endosymbiont of Epithemia turgida isolate EtSB Lake Yunoko]